MTYAAKNGPYTWQKGHGDLMTSFVLFWFPQGYPEGNKGKIPCITL